MDGTGRIAMRETLTKKSGSAVTPEVTVRYQLGDHLGTACVEIDGSGNLLSYEEYHPYGTTAWQAPSLTTVSLKRYKYTGMERDEETGLQRHGVRYYAAWLGRWTSADPIGLGDGVNRYGYCRGGPVGAVDGTGLGAVADARFLRSADFGPFTGTAATGESPSHVWISPGDTYSLAAGDPAVHSRYRNPLTQPARETLALTQEQRVGQATTLLSAPITTAAPASYGSTVPTRAEFIASAAAVYNVDPLALGAIVLAEQRDQSMAEDVVERYAVRLGGDRAKEQSVGIAQIGVKTAVEDGLVQGGDQSPSALAERLLYDDVSILAAAKYLRKIADVGKDVYPDQDPSLFEDMFGLQRDWGLGDYDPVSLEGNKWGREATMVVGSEYTSRLFDGRPGSDGFDESWALHVGLAYEDVARSRLLATP